MGEFETERRTLGAGEDHPGLLRFVEALQHAIGFGRSLENFQLKRMSDRRGASEYRAGRRAEALEPSSDNQPNTFRHLQVADFEIRVKTSGRIVEPVLHLEMQIQFLDEEWISFGLAKDFVHHSSGRRLPAEAGQHLPDFLMAEAGQANRNGGASTE
jgi:hypothetical protein